MMSPHTTICVSYQVKRIVDHCRRTDESRNDFLERILIGEMRDYPGDPDQESDTQSDLVSLHRKRAKIRRRAWIRQLPTDSTDIDD